jgi:hypothetical protein
MKPLFTRVFEQGAAAGPVFGRSRLFGFGRTSGTLGEPKNLPLHRAYLDSLDRTLVRLVASHVHTSGAWDTLLTGKHIMLGSRPRCGTSPTGLPICDISGLAATRTSWAARFLNIPRHRDLWIEDWPVKAERILEQARGQQVVSISGIPALAADLVRRARAKYQVTHLDAVWPQLRHYIYGGTHLTSSQREEINTSWFKSDRRLNFYETYFSTEGPLAFSYEQNQEGLALNTLENLYLFRPCSGDGAFLFADELQPGVLYSIHVTTPGGLVNYRMGDRIEVVSTRPLLIRVAGREAEEISMTGEKITLAQIDLALSAVGLGAAAFRTHLPVVWVEESEPPRLVWGVPASSDLEEDPAWAPRLDQALCKLNILYAEALLREQVIGSSRVVLIPMSVFAKAKDSRLGVSQFKARRMFNSQAEFAAAYPFVETPSSPTGDG